jgi:hypothetical protein
VTVGDFRAAVEEADRVRLLGIWGLHELSDAVLHERVHLGLPTDGTGDGPHHLPELHGAAVLAVESKCTEAFTAHQADFRPAYREAMASVHPSWRSEYEREAQVAYRGSRTAFSSGNKV